MAVVNDRSIADAKLIGTIAAEVSTLAIKMNVDKRFGETTIPIRDVVWHLERINQAYLDFDWEIVAPLHGTETS